MKDKQALGLLHRLHRKLTTRVYNTALAAAVELRLEYQPVTGETLAICMAFCQRIPQHSEHKKRQISRQ